MYEKIITASIVLCVLVGSCAHSPDSGAGRAVQSSAESIGELREQNRELTERLARESELREQLRTSIAGAEAELASTGGDIRRAIQILVGYKAAVDKYFFEISRIPERVANPNEDRADFINNTDSSDSAQGDSNSSRSAVPANQ